MLAAINLRERKLDKFREISTEKMTSYMSARLPELPQALLDQKLNFTRSQIVNGFIHSSFFSMNSIVQFGWCNSIYSNNENIKRWPIWIRMHGSTTALAHSSLIWAHSPARKRRPMITICRTDSHPNSRHPMLLPFGNCWRGPKTCWFATSRKFTMGKLFFAKLFCSLSRQVGGRDPEKYGRWRITDMNFFDCQFAFGKLHTY